MTDVLSVLKRIAVPGILLVLVATTAVVLWPEEDRKTLVAYFPRTVSVYEGSDVRVLGVAIGEIEKVVPSGTDVEVTMSYDPDVDIPADAKAVIVAPSVVGDRYVQLTPAYDGGPTLESGAELGVDRTAVPLELDQIYSNLDDLVVALGPDGANREGALTDLLRQTAANFGGTGEQVNQTIHDFGELSGTLDANKEQLFGSAQKLHNVLRTLAESDRTVRDFNTSLADVSTMLAGEREELATALQNLSTALGAVHDFVETNRDLLGSNIRGLNRVLGVLVRQRAALQEILTAAPVALLNLGRTYNPTTGTLDTNANLGSLVHEITSNPEQLLCGMVTQVDDSGELCDVISGLLPRGAAFGAGSGSSIGQRSDPTLAGLVEVGE